MVKIEFTPLSLDRKIFPFKKGFKKDKIDGCLCKTKFGTEEERKTQCTCKKRKLNEKKDSSHLLNLAGLVIFYSGHHVLVLHNNLHWVEEGQVWLHILLITSEKRGVSEPSEDCRSSARERSLFTLSFNYSRYAYCACGVWFICVCPVLWFVC